MGLEGRLENIFNVPTGKNGADYNMAIR